MKKLRFEDVLEHLRSGQRDPAFERQLSQQPDGPRMLEEARLMHALIRGEATEGASGDDADSEVFGVADAASEYSGAQLSLEPWDTEDDRVGNDSRMISPKSVRAASKLAQRAAGRMRTIGELGIGVRESEVRLSFEPATSGIRARPIEGKLPPKSKGDLDAPYQMSRQTRKQQGPRDFGVFMRREAPESGLRMRGGGIEITGPDTLSAPGPIQLRVEDLRLRVPARGLEMIFLPEAGPFSRFHTNSAGIAELPMPDYPGILRIETRPPQLMRIRLELLL